MAEPASDMSGALAALVLLKDWGFLGVLTTGFLTSVGFIWRTSSKVTKALGHIDTHAELIEKIEVRVKGTETAQQTVEVRLAAQPTHADITAIRSELASAMASLQSQLQAGFAQMMQLFSARPH